MRPKLIMLIGLPATGKSTFKSIRTTPSHNGDCLFRDFSILSTDDYIDEVSERLNITYSEAFEAHIKDATNLFNAEMKFYSTVKCNVLVDRTNLTKKSRKNILDMFPTHEKIAIVFSITDKKKHDWLLNNRNGKNIPINVIENMRASFEYPVEGEFDAIYNVIDFDYKEVYDAGY